MYPYKREILAPANCPIGYTIFHQTPWSGLIVEPQSTSRKWIRPLLFTRGWYKKVLPACWLGNTFHIHRLNTNYDTVFAHGNQIISLKGWISIDFQDNGHRQIVTNARYEVPFPRQQIHPQARNVIPGGLAKKLQQVDLLPSLRTNSYACAVP